MAGPGPAEGRCSAAAEGRAESFGGSDGGPSATNGEFSGFGGAGDVQGGRDGGVRENITHPYGGLGGAAGSCPDDEDDEASGTPGNEGEEGIGGKGETGRGGIAVEDGTRDEGHGAGGTGGRAPTATSTNGGQRSGDRGTGTAAG